MSNIDHCCKPIVTTTTVNTGTASSSFVAKLAPKETTKRWWEHTLVVDFTYCPPRARSNEHDLTWALGRKTGMKVLSRDCWKQKVPDPKKTSAFRAKVTLRAGESLDAQEAEKIIDRAVRKWMSGCESLVSVDFDLKSEQMEKTTKYKEWSGVDQKS